MVLYTQKIVSLDQSFSVFQNSVIVNSATSSQTRSNRFDGGGVGVIFPGLVTFRGSKPRFFFDAIDHKKLVNLISYQTRSKLLGKCRNVLEKQKPTLRIFQINHQENNLLESVEGVPRLKFAHATTLSHSAMNFGTEISDTFAR